MAIQARDVSLYIPVRNAARTLAAAIESVRGQTVAPAEFFLVVDTRSTDDSLALARRSGLRVVEQTDGRLGYARNLALRACRTPWLASCDSDVTLEAGWLEALIAVADETVAAVGGRTEERLHTAADRWRAVNLPHNWGRAAFDNPFMLVSEMLARVAAFRTIGGYRADLQFWEDSDASQRLRQAGFTLRYAPAAVAWHDRRDTIASVLELRWQYAAYRQRTRLESLEGLVQKLPINRTYCLQSLSQTLHSPHADVCALAAWLWFHHARRDLRAALQQWPLLSPAECAACDAAVQRLVVSSCVARWPEISGASEALLAPLDLQTAGAGGTAFAADVSFANTAGFVRYLDRLGAETRRLVQAIPLSIDRALETSAAALAAPSQRVFEPPALAAPGADEMRCVTASLTPAWHWQEIAALAGIDTGGGAGSGRLRVVGAALDAERPRDDGSWSRVGDPQDEFVLIPHLEQFAAPLRVLTEALACAATAAIAYRAPDDFEASVPWLSARDLASAAAENGFVIAHFQAQAGQCRLVLRRSGVSPACEATRKSARGRASRPAATAGGCAALR